MPVRRLHSFSLAIAFLATQSLWGEVKVLKNFTLIDGTGRAPAPSSAMIIDNGRITWVGPAAQLKAPAGAEVTDLTGKFVMPGIINLHGHVGNTLDYVNQDSKIFSRQSVEKQLKDYAAYGVTAVISMGTDKDLMFQIRAEQRAGRPTMARVYTAGQGMILKGGYGGIEGTNEGLSNVSQVETAVAAQAAKGVDFIKLWLDDELGHFPKMPPEMSKAIIDSAHKHNLRALAHVFYYSDAEHLVNQGINGLVHSVRDKPVDQAMIANMKKHGTWQMAGTLSREASMFAYGQTPVFINDPFFTKRVAPATLQLLSSPERQKTITSDPNYSKYPSFLEMAKKNMKMLADNGVKYGFGTDTGPPGRFAGYGEHWELQLMVEAGFTPMQALTAATRSAAEFLGAKDLGTIEKSKWADLLVLDADPLADIKNSRKINKVFIAGNVVN